ncbi:MAG: GNAT family N-acetyltransferase [Bacteroidetes bacterium]|nr:GNAT family N-acetyltransferase [Bacteroidota bacterium]
MKSRATERLELQKLSISDVDWLLELHTNPEVMKYIWPCYPKAVDLDLERKRLAKMVDYNNSEPHFGYYGISIPTAGKSIGWACLKHLDGGALIEIGYRLFPEYWGKGYATEAASSLMEMGWKELNLQKIVGITAPANEASKKVLLKLGLQYVGRNHFYNTDVDFFEMKRTH